MLRSVLAIFSIAALLAGQEPPPVPDFTPPTPLFGAVMGGDTQRVKQLLDDGADPNEGRFIGGATPLIVALMQANTPVARLLIEQGADVKATDLGGATPLMWAAGYEVPDASIVRELLRRGADPNVKNKASETALTWALRRGYTPVVEILKEHGASDAAMVRSSVERALALLQKSGPEFVKVSGCSSCHNQSLPQMTYSLARERGLHIDPVMADKQAKSIVAMFKPLREKMLAGKAGIPDPAISVSYLLIGLGAEGYKPDETTAAMAHVVSGEQMPDGSFRSFAARPPIESSSVSATALSIRALQYYGANPDAQIAKGREWLRTFKPRTTEEHTMKLLGLFWSKAPAADLQSEAKELLAQQRQDGGWAQLPTLESDAYATGQALVALHAAGQITVSDISYGRGAAFLLRTQRPDGSWLVRSRAVPFQPYKESGFPHGKDQWISATGTSWAAMALMASMPPVAQHVSRVF